MNLSKLESSFKLTVSLALVASFLSSALTTNGKFLESFEIISSVSAASETDRLETDGLEASDDQLVLANQKLGEALKQVSDQMSDIDKKLEKQVEKFAAKNRSRIYGYSAKKAMREVSKLREQALQMENGKTKESILIVLDSNLTDHEKLLDFLEQKKVTKMKINLIGSVKRAGGIKSFIKNLREKIRDAKKLASSVKSEVNRIPACIDEDIVSILSGSSLLLILASIVLAAIGIITPPILVLVTIILVPVIAGTSADSCD